MWTGFSVLQQTQPLPFPVYRLFVMRRLLRLNRNTRQAMIVGTLLSIREKKISSHPVCDQLRLPRGGITMPFPITEMPGHLQAELAVREPRMTRQRR